MAKDNQPTQEHEKTESKETKNVSSSSNTPKYLAIGAGAMIILILAFLAGTIAQVHHNNVEFSTFGPKGSGMVRMMGDDGFGKTGFMVQPDSTALSGKVTAVSGSNFTLNQNGSSKTVKTDSNTRVMGVGIDGLKANDQVAVFGSVNSDGSIQALRVMVITTNSTF